MSKRQEKIRLERNCRFKTIELLEKNIWPNPEGEYATNLVKKCHALRKKVLDDFTVEDLRIMIGQAIGLDYLVPLAIEVLSDDLFAEGDLYEGDLLNSVLTIDPGFWIAQHEYWIEIKKLITGREDELAAQKISTVNFELER
jgi:hypothetical protein